ncbi:MAG: hypothetical protein GKR91_02725 [Pseudomonadales bacterium]|nr:hypothetical protein [Pseudomonadales bacterium]
MRGIIHFHSCYSYDSNVKIDSIISFALKNEIGFLILTDHDTIDGSLALRRRIKELGLPLIAPIAAEYCTEYGDVIAAFISNEIEERDLDGFVNNVNEQEGLLLFPHPYQGHRTERIEEIAGNMDLIETYNQRCSDYYDEQASQLANKYKLTTYSGSDAHLLSEFGNVIVDVECENTEKDLRRALVSLKVSNIRLRKTRKYNIQQSQIIKAIKTRNFRILIRNILALFIAAVRFRLRESC